MSDILISITSLLIVAGSSIGAILSKHYRDNWLQFAGLWGILFWSLGRSWQLAERYLSWLMEPLTPAPDMSTQSLIGHSGLALFAIGTAWKVFRNRHVITKDGDLQRAELQ
jgi:hypothetical protein